MKCQGGKGDVGRALALDRLLRSGFRVAVIAGVLFCLWVAVSGVYWVDEGAVAIHLRFGEVLGEGVQAVVPPGGPYLGFPDPIDQVITVPTAIQRLALDDEFWCGRANREGLRPGEDGSLITGDHNIVHGRWQVAFRVSPEGSAPLRFVQTLGSVDRARTFLRCVVQEALVTCIGQMSVDDFTKGAIDEQAVVLEAQRRLDDARCGLEIVDISRSAPPQVPFQVLDDFLAVNEAESAKLKAVENAWRERENSLNATAGVVFGDLVEALDARDQAQAQGDDQAASAAHRVAVERLESERLGGEASVILQDARSYRTSLVEGFRSRAERYDRLLPVWRTDRAILHDRLLWETWQDVLTGTVNAYYLPHSGSKTIYLHLQDSLNGL